MPLVEQQVEHLVRPTRSNVSHKEKKTLTSKVKIDAVQSGSRLDGNNSVSDALGVIGATVLNGISGVIGETGVDDLTGEQC